jgi:hypothetical protein
VKTWTEWSCSECNLVLGYCGYSEKVLGPIRAAVSINCDGRHFFLCRSTLTPDHRLGRVFERDMQRRPESGDIFPTRRELWLRRGLSLPSDEVRSRVYAYKMWVKLPIGGQPRDVSPQNYRFVHMTPSLALGRVCVLFCY